jgi:hypothetical protein
MYIDIDKEAIPYQFDIELAGELFTMDIRYNERADFFTVDLSKDDNPIVIGEKIVYGRPLFSTISNSMLPASVIFPIDESGRAVDKITWDNFMETVVLLVGEVDE